MNDHDKLRALPAKWRADWPDYDPAREDEYEPANRAARAVMRCADELEAALAALGDTAAPKPVEGVPDVFSYDPFPSRRTVDVRWPDGRILAYTLDTSLYTDTPEVIAALAAAQQQEADRG